MVNIEEVYENIFRITIPIGDYFLRDIRPYIILDKNRSLLIDTGYNTDYCFDALEEGLNFLGIKEDSFDIYLTHLHSDHIGLVNKLAGKNATVYLGTEDFNYIISLTNANIHRPKADRYYKEGFIREWDKKIMKDNPTWAYSVYPENIKQWVRCNDKFKIKYGAYNLETISVPGHTPGSTMLWENDKKIMFTGDHVLFDLFPNISGWVSFNNPLKSYLKSLDYAYSFPVELALPAHGDNNGDYHDRIKIIKEHYLERIENTLKIVSENPGLNACEIASKFPWLNKSLKWEDFPYERRWIAFEECLAHLDYLRDMNIIERTINKDTSSYKLK